MAEKIAGKGHNAVDPSDAIKQLHADLLPEEAKVTAAKASMRKLRNKFKSDTDMALADFDAARRLAKMDDDIERIMKVNNFHRCYNALVPGQQLDMLDVMEKQDGKAPTKH